MLDHFGREVHRDVVRYIVVQRTDIVSVIINVTISGGGDSAISNEDNWYTILIGIMDSLPPEPSDLYRAHRSLPTRTAVHLAIVRVRARACVSA